MVDPHVIEDIQKLVEAGDVRRAIEKHQVVFYDVAYIEIKPHIRGNSVAVELTDFSVFYNQDTIATVEQS